MKKKNLIAGHFFILLIASVLLVRFNPVIFDFTIIHNLFGPNILFRNNVIGIAWFIGMLSLFLTLLYGPLFCGYVCPFGTLQKVLSHIGTVIGIKKIKPKKLHSAFSIVKYLVLGYFVFLILNDDVWTYINLDPYHAFIRLFFGGITLIGGIYLIIVVLLSLFVERPFCNYLCPYGAGLNLISSMRVFRINRVDDICIQCKKCDQACPVQIDITNKEIVNDIDCLSCHNCLDVCPKEGAIKKKFHLSGLIVLIIIMAGFIYIAKPVDSPLLDETFVEAIIEEEVIEETVDLEEEIVILKETSTVDIYYDNAIDILPVELTKLKNANAILIYEEKLAAKLEAERIEAERLAKLKAEKIAREKAEAERIAQEKAEADRIAEEEALLAGGAIYYNGVYTATVNAYRPNMTVQVEIVADKIISIEIIDHNESRSYYNYTAPKMIKKIIDNNTTNVNIVAGATYTSLGIRNGVKSCLKQAEK